MCNEIIIISCSVFRNELEHLQTSNRLKIPVIYLDSMLHMKPTDLQNRMDQVITKYPDSLILLLFGECHAKMVDYEQNHSIIRTPGINCAEIFLGSKTYKELRREGAFILLPEWLHRWKEVFVKDLGFKSSKTARQFMNEMHKKLVYVDTGCHRRDYQKLAEISDFLGLPLQYHTISISELEQRINSVLARFDSIK